MTRKTLATCVAILGGFVLAGRAEAGLLDPMQFASLGTLSLGPGTYTISDQGSGEFLTGNGLSIQGVVSGGVVVFDFDSISIASGASLQATPGLNPGPIALLSRSSATVAGSIDVSAFANQGGAGAGYGSAGLSGSQQGSGGGGGGFGGPGGSGGMVSYSGYNFQSSAAGGLGGAAAGYLGSRLIGGSAGGNGGSSNRGSQAGSGGGAIELGAVGNLSVTGTILAFGGNAGYPGGGGGSGGGIFLHANNVSVTGSLYAQGGGGASGDSGFGGGGGGGGGGGEILVQYFASGPASNDSHFHVLGGPGGSGRSAFSSGSNSGILIGSTGATGMTGASQSQAIPEPSSLALLGTSTLGLAGYALARRRAARRPGD